MIREPVAAGKFYPGNRTALEKQINSFYKPVNKRSVISCIMPHAGYVYSGKVATLTAASVEIKKNLILLGPNHTGMGSQFSIMSEGSWKTPLGEIKINSEIANSLKKKSGKIKEDADAHMHEHSLEVELPILQLLSQDEFSFVPLTLMQGTKTAYEEIAGAIADSITELKISKETLIVASSDMTHYESHESAKEKDQMVIDAIENLDTDLLLERVEKFQISMCGYVPVVIAIIASKKLGANKGELILYQTSAEASGDYDAVVGYAGMIIY